MEMHPYCPSCGCQFELFELEPFPPFALFELLPVVLLLFEPEPEFFFDLVEPDDFLLLEPEPEFFFDLVESDDFLLLEPAFDFPFAVLELDEFWSLMLFLLELPPQAVIDSAIAPTTARIKPFFKNPFFFLSFLISVCIVLSSLSLIRISKASLFLLLFL